MTTVKYIAINGDNNEPIRACENLTELKEYVDGLNKKINRDGVKIIKETITTKIEMIQ